PGRLRAHFIVKRSVEGPDVAAAAGADPAGGVADGKVAAEFWRKLTASAEVVIFVPLPVAGTVNRRLGFAVAKAARKIDFGPDGIIKVDRPAERVVVNQPRRPVVGPAVVHAGTGTDFFRESPLGTATHVKLIAADQQLLAGDEKVLLILIKLLEGSVGFDVQPAVAVAEICRADPELRVGCALVRIMLKAFLVTQSADGEGILTKLKRHTGSGG